MVDVAARVEAQDANRRLRYFVVVSGVPHVWQSSPTTLPSDFLPSTYARHKTLHNIDLGEDTIDTKRRRMIGGSATIQLLDDNDRTLAELFAARVRRRTWVTADATAAATTISVDDTEKISTASSGTFWIGQECITYTGKTGSTAFTGCTRGAFGSRARPVCGGVADGDGVYDVPPSWMGRRVTIYMYDEEGGDVISEGLATIRKTVGVYRLEEAPAYLGAGIWELRCSTLADEFGALSVYTGIEPMGFVGRPTASAVTGVETGVATAITPELSKYLTQATGTDAPATHALFRSDEEATNGTYLVHRILSVTDSAYSAPLSTELVTEDRRDCTTSRNDWPLFASVSTVQHIAILRSSGGDVLNQILASNVGDEANGPYDLLPGREREELGAPSWRFGANIDEDEIDDASIQAIAGSQPWAYVLCRTMRLEDVLWDFCLHFNCFWYVSTEGLLTFALLSRDNPTGSVTVNNDELLREPTVTVDEGAVVSRIRLRCDHDAIADEYFAEYNGIDEETTERFPSRGEAVELESRTLKTRAGIMRRNQGTSTHLRNVHQYVSSTEMALRMRRTLTQDGRPSLRVRALLSMRRFFSLDLGDMIDLSLSLPDFEGNTTIANPARIVARKFNIKDGTLDLTFDVEEKTRLIGPAALISSIGGGGSNVLTLSTAAPADGSNPGDMFAVGASVTVWDVSAQAQEGDYTITAASTTTITLNSGPAFAGSAGALEAGVDFVTLNAYETNTSTAASVDGYVEDDFIYQMPDDEAVYIDAGVAVTRWR